MDDTAPRQRSVHQHLPHNVALGVHILSGLLLSHALLLPYRAKLEEALERMDRVVMAIERDGAQPSPYTSDLAVQAKHVQLVDNDAADDLSPALQQASTSSSSPPNTICISRHARCLMWHQQSTYSL